jgi:hypothetical protein
MNVRLWRKTDLLTTLTDVRLSSAGRSLMSVSDP